MSLNLSNFAERLQVVAMRELCLMSKRVNPTGKPINRLIYVGNVGCKAYSVTLDEKGKSVTNIHYDAAFRQLHKLGYIVLDVPVWFNWSNKGTALITEKGWEWLAKKAPSFTDKFETEVKKEEFKFKDRSRYCKYCGRPRLMNKSLSNCDSCGAILNW